jgi:hypothetical protein
MFKTFILMIISDTLSQFHDNVKYIYKYTNPHIHTHIYKIFTNKHANMRGKTLQIILATSRIDPQNFFAIIQILGS